MTRGVRIDRIDRSGGPLSGERGSAAVELPFVLGLIVIPFAFLVLQLPRWVEHQAAATDAAAEIARSAAIDQTSADPARLLAIIESAHELPPGSLHVVISEATGPGEAITVEVTVDIPALILPVFGDVGPRSWSTSHTERHPDYGAARP